MATNPTSQVIQHLRRVLLQDDAGPTDGQLLGSFIESHDEAAFAALVKRHGRLVWNVCRRLLGEHDAEDAFQTTFLVLCRKATSIRHRERVASWLYGVAHQTALQARRAAARRRAREKQVVDMPEPIVAEQDLWNDLQPLLDQELSRLPDNYQVVILLCDMEGKTRKEAARQLGLPEGTVASRLTRARAMLAKRLARHGLVVSGGALTAVLSEKAASACVPTSLLSSTIKDVTVPLVATGQAAATGVISGTVAALTEGVIKTMFLSKIMKLMGLLLVIGALSGGAELIYHMQAAEPPKEQQANDRPQAAKGKDTDKQKQARDDLAKLQGTWRPVSCEVESVRLGEDRPEYKDTRMVIDKSSIQMTGKVIHSPELKQEPEDYKAVGTFTLDTKKNPKVIVITWETNPTLTKEYFTQRGIYALEGDSLKVCFYNPGSDTKDLIPTEFSANAGSKRAVSIWRRVPRSEKGQQEKRPKDRPAPGGAAKHDTVKNDKERIQGTWRPVKMEINGVELPLLLQPKEGLRLTLTAEKGTSNFFMDERDFTFKLDPASKPKAIDLHLLKPDETLLGIYQLEGDDLMICVCIKGKVKRPSAFENYWRAGSHTALLALKRQKPDK